MIYISAPYSHSDSSVRDERMKQVYALDARLTCEGKFTVSPLYKVELTRHHELPATWEYWKEYSYELLSRCDRMYVLMLPGWQESPGVTAEIEFAQSSGIPITYINIDVTGVYQDYVVL